MNRKQKGSRGERACRDVWKKHGYEEAHRSQQYSGKGESSADLEGISELLHIEVKSGYSYKTIYDFLDQSIRDAKENQIPIVTCKMDRKEWLCVLRLDDFIEIFKDYDKVPIQEVEVNNFVIDEPTDDWQPTLLGRKIVSLDAVSPAEWWENRIKECGGCRYFDEIGRCLNFTNGCVHGSMNTSRRTEE